MGISWVPVQQQRLSPTADWGLWWLLLSPEVTCDRISTPGLVGKAVSSKDVIGSNRENLSRASSLFLKMYLVKCVVLTIEINVAWEALICFKCRKPWLLHRHLLFKSTFNVVHKILISIGCVSLCLWVCFAHWTASFSEARAIFPVLFIPLPVSWRALKLWPQIWGKGLN